MKKLLILICSLILLSCTTNNSFYKPTVEQLKVAHYGSKPLVSNIPQMVRNYLKISKYYDPNGAEIEECAEPVKGWIDDLSVDYDINNPYLYGWKTQCDINSKNRIGGFTGFKRKSYFIKNDQVIKGYIPGNESTSLKKILFGNSILGLSLIHI